MPESQKHKNLKECASRVFGGKTERKVNGRADVKTPNFCIEVELSGKTDRMKRATEKLSSSGCGGGFLAVPSKDFDKAVKLTGNEENIIPISTDKLKNICDLE